MQGFPLFWSNKDIHVIRASDSFNELIAARATEKRTHVMKCAANRGQLVFCYLAAPVAPAASRCEVNGDRTAKLVCCHGCSSLSVGQALPAFSHIHTVLFPSHIPIKVFGPGLTSSPHSFLCSFRYVRYARCRCYTCDTAIVHREAAKPIMSRRMTSSTCWMPPNWDVKPTCPTMSI